MTQTLFSRPTRRYLTVWCPQLPLDRWRRRDDPRLWGAFAVTERAANADRILVCNDHAAAAGVRAGQSLSDARAVCPDILTEPCEPTLEARLLSALNDLGPGLADICLHCCCFLEGLEVTEKNMGWSARSGKIVLRIALQRLVRHYEEQGKYRPLIG